MNDPEVQKAATTIQAGFRGHMTRKQLKSPQGTVNSASALMHEIIYALKYEFKFLIDFLFFHS